MGKIRFLAGFFLGAIFFVACGTAEVKFPYKFFHASPIQVWDYPSGVLKGQGQENHRELKECRPVKNSQGKMVQRCVIVFYEELNKVVADYKKTKQALIDCERGR